MAQCSVCLSNFRDPVCTPCGHVYCKRCLSDFANAPGNNRLSAKCPECRATFELVVPDLTYLPEKYHSFVSQPVRRIYVDLSDKDLLEKLKATEDRLARKAAMEQALLSRCEELTEALFAHRQGERDANQRIMELEDDIASTERLVMQKDDKIEELQNSLAQVMSRVDSLKISDQYPGQDKVSSIRHRKSKDTVSGLGTDVLDDETLVNRRLSSSPLPLDSSPVAFRSKGKQKKYVVHLPHNQSCSDEGCTIQVSTSKNVPIEISMSRNPYNRLIKPLPKRGRSTKKRMADTPWVMSVEDFV